MEKIESTNHQKLREEVICPDCMAHYPSDYNHVCPPWLKHLVKLHKMRKAKSGEPDTFSEFFKKPNSEKLPVLEEIAREASEDQRNFISGEPLADSPKASDLFY